MKKTVVVFFMLLCASMPALAERKIEILETYPAGQDVQLASNQTYYVHVTYQFDSGAYLYVHPYFRGQRVNVSSSPGLSVSGSGERLDWFSLKPGDEVDEIRAYTGNVLAQSLPVHVVGVAGDSSDTSLPAWVTELQAQADAEHAQREAEAKKDLLSPSGIATIVFMVLAFVVPPLAVLICSVGAMWRWRGGWRIAAALPLAVLVLKVVNIAIGVSRDPTSHNLLPFEILMVSAVGLVALFVISAVRKALGVGKENDVVDD